MLEKQLELLTEATNRLTVVLENQINGFTPGTAEVPPGAARKKRPSRSKAALKAAEEAEAAEAVSPDLSAQELLVAIGALVKPLGPRSQEIGAFLTKLGYAKVTLVPEGQRQEVLDQVTAFQATLLAKIDESEFLG